jgi:hypothetical protein
MRIALAQINTISSRSVLSSNVPRMCSIASLEHSANLSTALVVGYVGHTANPAMRAQNCAALIDGRPHRFSSVEGVAAELRCVRRGSRAFTGKGVMCGTSCEV